MSNIIRNDDDNDIEDNDETKSLLSNQKNDYQLVGGNQSDARISRECVSSPSKLWDYEELGFTPEMLWVSNFLTPTLLFAYRTFLVVYMIMMMAWSGVEHKHEASRAYLHLTNYSHLLFAAYLKFGVFFSARAAFYDVKPLCERDSIPQPPTKWVFFPYKFAWLLLELAFTWSFVLVVMHWLLYSHDGSTLNNAFVSVHNRGGLFTLVALDVLLCRVEFVPAHIWINIAGVTILLIMHIIYNFVKGEPSYYFLDFKRLPIMTSLFRVFLIYVIFIGAFLLGDYGTRGRNEAIPLFKKLIDDTVPKSSRPEKKPKTNQV